MLLIIKKKIAISGKNIEKEMAGLDFSLFFITPVIVSDIIVTAEIMLETNSFDGTKVYFNKAIKR